LPILAPAFGRGLFILEIWVATTISYPAVCSSSFLPILQPLDLYSLSEYQNFSATLHKPGRARRALLFANSSNLKSSTI
jgi:hypothetical protein